MGDLERTHIKTLYYHKKCEIISIQTEDATMFFEVQRPKKK